MAKIPPTDISYTWIAAKDLDTLTIDKTQFDSLANRTPLNDNYFFLCASSSGNVVGLIKVYTAQNASNMHVEFFEVANDFRGRGISEPLYGKLFERAQAEGKVITSDGRTESGKSHLSRIVERNQQKYGQDAYQVIGRV